MQVLNLSKLVLATSSFVAPVASPLISDNVQGGLNDSFIGMDCSEVIRWLRHRTLCKNDCFHTSKNTFFLLHYNLIWLDVIRCGYVGHRDSRDDDVEEADWWWWWARESASLCVWCNKYWILLKQNFITRLATTFMTSRRLTEPALIFFLEARTKVFCQILHLMSILTPNT